MTEEFRTPRVHPVTFAPARSNPDSVTILTSHARRMAEQAHGMAIDVIGLERIAKLEAHLDAKIQRLLRLLKGLKPTSSSKAR